MRNINCKECGTMNADVNFCKVCGTPLVDYTRMKPKGRPDFKVIAASRIHASAIFMQAIGIMQIVCTLLAFKWPLFVFLGFAVGGIINIFQGFARRNTAKEIERNGKAALKEYYDKHSAYKCAYWTIIFYLWTGGLLGVVVGFFDRVIKSYICDYWKETEQID